MADRLINLRYPASCSNCAGHLPAGTRAWWDSDDKVTRCQPCGTKPGPKSAGSAAGNSAQREYERRKSKRRVDARAHQPHLGGMILALKGDPRTTTNWARGAKGERKVGARLDALADDGVVVLHDRLRPGTRANIDHLAVAPSGVWVIDAKRYRGQVVKNDVGAWFSPELRLYVGRRDCTKLVRDMSTQVAVVREALGAKWAAIPVHPVLCFVDAEWRLFAKPFDIRGVVVTWPTAARELVARPGPCPPDSIEIIAATLEERLRPAS